VDHDPVGPALTTGHARDDDDAVTALTSLLEPIIIVFLGVVIGGLVVAMYLPIFKLGSVV